MHVVLAVRLMMVRPRRDVLDLVDVHLVSQKVLCDKQWTIGTRHRVHGLCACCSGLADMPHKSTLLQHQLGICNHQLCYGLGRHDACATGMQGKKLVVLVPQRVLTLMLLLESFAACSCGPGDAEWL